MHAYIDETGNSFLTLHKAGTSKFFMVGCVLVDPQHIHDIEERLDHISQLFFSNREIKSSNVKKVNRREKIFENIKDLPFKFLAIIVDKSEIFDESGLKFKPSFYKFVNALLYKKLIRSIPDIKIFADQTGWPTFQDSFIKYINKNHVPTIFSSTPQISLLDSKDNRLIQLADFLVGTFSKQYEKKNKELNAIKLLGDKLIDLEIWPPKVIPQRTLNFSNPDSDTLVEEHSINQVKEFLVAYSTKEDIITKCQIEVIKLLYQNYVFGEDEYINKEYLIKKINLKFSLRYKERMFNSKIMNPLRDKHVMLTSSYKGIKIPTSLNDIITHFETINGIALPMLKRTISIGKDICLITNGREDLLKKIPEFKYLNELEKIFTNQRLNPDDKN